jgi:hypothetical protein
MPVGVSGFPLRAVSVAFCEADFCADDFRASRFGGRRVCADLAFILETVRSYLGVFRQPKSHAPGLAPNHVFPLNLELTLCHRKGSAQGGERARIHRQPFIQLHHDMVRGAAPTA